MYIEVLADPESVAQRAASIIAEEAWETIASRGRFVMAVSGGHTPWLMLRDLAAMGIPWRDVHIVQVDERVAPEGHPDRNLTHIRESLLAGAPKALEQIYPMPVGSAALESAAEYYAETLQKIAGEPPVLDLVHLGLGRDGHTASLVPDDPVLHVQDADVALSGPYQGRQRMTLTIPILNRARKILWVVTGGEKAEMCRQLIAGYRSIPAGRISRGQATVVADEAATATANNLFKGEVLCG
jgi:6-phosphogluconolactonase